jgi:hypothetical protein
LRLLARFAGWYWFGLVVAGCRLDVCWHPAPNAGQENTLHENLNEGAQDEFRVTVWIGVDRQREAVLACGDFRAVFNGYLDHVQRWRLPSDGLTLSMMRQGLAAAVLHLACRPRNEFAAWTLNTTAPPLNVFLAGDNHDFKITGRVYTRDVKTGDSSRLFVEVQQPNSETSRSSVAVKGLDLLHVFEQYYAASEQIHARLFELGEHEFALIQGLPDMDLTWFSRLGPEEIAAYRTGDSMQLAEERVYRFGCGCDPRLILSVIKGVFRDRPEDLFQDDTQVEVHCPRCGRRWWLSRQDFDTPMSGIGMA